MNPFYVFLLMVIQSLRLEMIIDSKATEPTIKCIQDQVIQESVVKGFIEFLDSTDVVDSTLDFKIINKQPNPNIFYSKTNLIVSIKQSFSFVTHHDDTIEYCLTLSPRQNNKKSNEMIKTKILLHIEISHNLKDLELTEKGKWSTFDTELIQLKNMLDDSLIDMNVFDGLDDEMNELNQNTKDRVFTFSTLSIVVLISLGGWQVW
ncbi:emp24/gp25L/p24 family/GOLD-domain-containing protein [Globomyces pollinis-pini]|nr:emp24/gp25L/p24 family/GOLD-domain-containing protein [Globomyces pollinis-pini]